MSVSSDGETPVEDGEAWCPYCEDWVSVKTGRLNLSGVDLSGCDLSNIIYDDSTIWPAGFTPPPVVQRKE